MNGKLHRITAFEINFTNGEHQSVIQNISKETVLT